MTATPGKRELHVRHMAALMDELGDDRITEEILQKVLHDNAAALYGLE